MYKKLSVLIPIYNEKDTIKTCVESVLSADIKDLELEVIISDNNSNDGTKEILNSFNDKRIKVLFREQNNGKGANIKNALNEATGDLILFQDGDLEYSPNDFKDLLEPFFIYNADVVYGSRFIGGDSHRVLYFWHSVANRFLTLLSNMMTDLNLTDMETCYKVFRREVLERIRLEEPRFGFDPEITAKISHQKPTPRIYEVGIKYNGRTYDEGKKIGWRDGIRVIVSIIRYNLFR